MPITDILVKNVELYGDEVALVEINPSLPDEKKVTWKEYSLIQSTANQPFRTEITWREFDIRANRFAHRFFCADHIENVIPDLKGKAQMAGKSLGPSNLLLAATAGKDAQNTGGLDERAGLSLLYVQHLLLGAFSGFALNVQYLSADHAEATGTFR